jgi:hypothetical protein
MAEKAEMKVGLGSLGDGTLNIIVSLIVVASPKDPMLQFLSFLLHFVVHVNTAFL